MIPMMPWQVNRMLLVAIVLLAVVGFAKALLDDGRLWAIVASGCLLVAAVIVLICDIKDLSIRKR